MPPMINMARQMRTKGNRVGLVALVIMSWGSISLPTLSYGQEMMSERPLNAPRKDKHRNMMDAAKRKQGLWKFFNDNGEILMEIEFLNNSREGMFKRYYSNGNPMEETDYLGGKKDGEFRRYFYSGEVSVDGKYNAGKKVGKWTKYYMDGSIKTEGEYANGKQDGIWKSYSRKGENTKVFIYRNGTKIQEFTGEQYKNKDLIKSPADKTKADKKAAAAKDSLQKLPPGQSAPPKNF